jgi:glycosyltransferase involved in cell wall biosynthesis
MKSFTVVMPCYNEEDTIREIVGGVMSAPRLGLDIELIIVDDGSRDRSREIIAELVDGNPAIKSFLQDRNHGKGAAVRIGIGLATGDIVLIQDADLEYDPTEYPKLLAPIVDGHADVVYGSRFAGGEVRRVLYFWHSIANRMLTLLSNMFTNLNLSDMECCFKVFKREIVQSITIKEDRFGIEPEITAKLARIKPAIRIYEVGISYQGRTYSEGKKIGLRDAFRALFCIVRYGLAR